MFPLNVENLMKNLFFGGGGGGDLSNVNNILHSPKCMVLDCHTVLVPILSIC